MILSMLSFDSSVHVSDCDDAAIVDTDFIDIAVVDTAVVDTAVVDTTVVGLDTAVDGVFLPR